ncbi:hypothetical protein [Billgrantia montanilacus]|uniref:hypothetical protein n=1 Tax=Billgrantia montanilacus TaxID=2282305 RepID=UPI0015F0EA9B|nr:hypothetical protein [Halomonas montanilacus]
MGRCPTECNENETERQPFQHRRGGNGRQEAPTADLAPTGRQQDIELGYRFQASRHGVLQLNLSHTLEPGHDRAARSDTAAVINYQVGF